MTIRILKKKKYRESWPKFKQVTKKVLTPQTLELLAFDEKSTFEWFALFLKAYKTRLASHDFI
jgi:hypothetical protein